ncbi:hypothetical protein EC968_007693 [Mortierella alpina]|nr:hypothetical protein EC968_007693 [Mortierella alpina]
MRDEPHEASILSGLSPEVIMEICTRAISFWTYQTAQEAKFQEMAQRTLEDKLGLVEKQLQRMTREVNVELNGLQEELEQERRKSADLSGQLEEKMRQLSKVQAQYDRQKRRPLFTDTLLQTHTQPLQERPAMPVLSGNPYHHYQVMNTQAPIASMPVEMHGSQPAFGAALQVGHELPPPNQNSGTFMYNSTNRTQGEPSL